MKRQIIKQIKSELHMLEVSSQPNEFDKHLYAIETLVAVLKEQKPDGKAGGATVAKEEHTQPAMTEKDARMLELMGGARKRDTPPEDEQKNDSIFDF